MPTTPARWSGGGRRGFRGGRAPRPGASPRPSCEAARGPGASPRPIHRRNRTKGPRRASAGPSGAADSAARIQPPIYRQGDLCPPSGREPPPSSCKRRFPQSPSFPCSPSPSLSRSECRRAPPGPAARRALPEKERRPPPGPPAFRAGRPSATVPGRLSMSEGFHHFDIEEA